MSNEVIEAIRRVLPLRAKRNSRGWMQFDCPACGDKRNRGGLLETPTGGFRYRCFNGGCMFEDATGWEPDEGLVGRPRRLFLALNGDLSDIPATMLEWRGGAEKDGQKRVLANKLEVATEFPPIDLPDGSMSVWETTSPNGRDAKRYLRDRCPIFTPDRYKFIWSPKYPRHVIVPLSHHGKYVGWIARKIDAHDKKFAHLKCANFPSDYMLNQDKMHLYDTILVVEGHFDALALHGVCTFGNTMTDKQINLLNQQNKKIILLPDYQKEEWHAYWQVAQQNNWYLSTPNWGGNYGSVDKIKDAGEAIKKMGLLAALQKIMSDESITNDYQLAADNCRYYSTRG